MSLKLLSKGIPIHKESEFKSTDSNMNTKEFKYERRSTKEFIYEYK